MLICYIKNVSAIYWHCPQQCLRLLQSFFPQKLKLSRTLQNCKHFRNNKSIMFFIIYFKLWVLNTFLNLRRSRSWVTCGFYKFSFLQKNGTFLANGLHKNIFNKRATKKNNIFGQRATKPYNLSQQATTKYNFSQRAKIIT